MKTPSTFQQGDVLLLKVTKPKVKGTIVAKGLCVIAHGESGNSHVIDVDESNAQLIRDGEMMLLNLKVSATLKHEEHDSIQLEPGLYEIGRVNEYDYISKMVRKVVD